MNRFTPDFFSRDTLQVARDILGARLVRQLNGTRLSGIIVECEAYIGQSDTACHASRGRTPRNHVMFGPPGYAYVYFTYGMHWMLNVVTEPEGAPAAVLFRAIQPEEGVETMRTLRQRKGKIRQERDLTAGPARLTQALAVDRLHNQTNLVNGNDLWLEPGEPYADEVIETGPRIGINAAQEHDRLLPWRFWVRGNRFVSR